MSDSIQLVEDFIAAWNARDVEKIMEHFAPDCVYHNIPMAPMEGADAIRNFITGFVSMASEIDWIVHHIAAGADGSVLTERTDRFLLGESWLELPVMGTFDIADGKIKGWRDYFDLADFERQMPKG